MSPEPPGEGDMAPKGWHFDLSHPWEVNIIYVSWNVTRKGLKIIWKKSKNQI